MFCLHLVVTFKMDLRSALVRFSVPSDFRYPKLITKRRKQISTRAAGIKKFMSVQTAWLEPFNMKYVNKYCSAQGYKSEISERCARRVSDEKRQEARLYIVYVNQGPFPLGWQAIQFFGRRRSNSRGHFALKHKLNNNNNRKHYNYCCRWATWHSYINCVGIFLSVDRNSTLQKLHDSRKQFCRRFFNVLNVYVFKTKWYFILYHAIENYKQEYLLGQEAMTECIFSSHRSRVSIVKFCQRNKYSKS